MRCPHCNRPFDASDGLDPDARPEDDPDNSMTICWGCLGLGIFARRPLDGSVYARKPTADEEFLAETPEFLAAKKAIERAKATHQGPDAATATWREGSGGIV